MSTLECPVKGLSEKNIEVIGKFVTDIRNGKLQGTLKIALAAVSFLEQLISETQNASAYQLCSIVREVGERICKAIPNEIVVGNMVLRVLRAIRDEHRAQANQSGEVAGESLQRLVLAAPSRRATLGPAEQDLREPIRDHIAELRAELESTESTISSQSRSHIDSDEVVLCCGHCPLLEAFLKSAAKVHTYRLIVAEGNNVREVANCCGHCPLLEAFLKSAAKVHTYRLIVAEGNNVKESQALASRLSNTGISVTVITNAAVFAVMSRVNKVVISIRAAIGGGAVLAPLGSYLLTSAAKHYNVPVLALAPLYTLVPLHAADRAQLIMSFASPLDTHGYQDNDTALTHVYAPRNDFLLPDMISLLITNLGGSSPSYVYRLLSELYDARDMELTHTF